MALINGEFEHPRCEVKILVLEPTKGELDYKEGMKVQVDWDFMLTTDVSELRGILKWMSDKIDFIESNFDKKGQIKQIRIRG